jgi:hypothetical protein
LVISLFFIEILMSIYLRYIIILINNKYNEFLMIKYSNLKNLWDTSLMYVSMILGVCRGGRGAAAPASDVWDYEVNYFWEIKLHWNPFTDGPD